MYDYASGVPVPAPDGMPIRGHWADVPESGGMPLYNYGAGAPMPSGMPMYDYGARVPAPGVAMTDVMPVHNYGTDASTSDRIQMYNYGYALIPPRIGEAGFNGQYKDGMILYQYVASNPIRFMDPQGTDILLKTGNNSWNPINNAIHQNVCVATCGRVIACFSFGLSGWGWTPYKRTWLGWSLPWWESIKGGYGPRGEIYAADDAGTVVATKTTTAAQDRAWLRWMLSVRRGTHDLYTVTWFNCRTYSQWEFADAPGSH